jgi:hypothetical protein
MRAGLPGDIGHEPRADLDQDRLLVGEVVEDRRAAERNGAGDVVDAGLVDAVALEELYRRLDDALARLLPLRRPASAAVGDRLRGRQRSAASPSRRSMAASN